MVINEGEKTKLAREKGGRVVEEDILETDCLIHEYVLLAASVVTFSHSAWRLYRRALSINICAYLSSRALR